MSTQASPLTQVPDKIVAVPGLGTVSFPGTMSDDDVSAAIRTHLASQPGAYQSAPGAPIQNARPNALVNDAGILEAPPDETGAEENQEESGASDSTDSETSHPLLSAIGKMVFASNPLLNTSPGVGMTKGASSTAYNLADLASRGAHAIAPNVPTMPPKPAALQPQGLGESAGNFAEQVGEFYAPEGLVGKGVDAAEAALKAYGAGSKLTKLGSLLAEMGLESGASAGITAVQGGDAKEGALLGAIAPVASKFVTEPLAEKYGPRIANALIKPRDAQFAFGKNPGQAVTEVGVTKDMPTLVGKLQALKNAAGNSIDAALSQPKYANTMIDLEPLVSQPIDDAIQRTLAKPMGAGKQELLDGLLEMKNDFLNTRALDQHGNLVNAAPRNMVMNPFDATQFKRDVGDSTRWTGSAFDKDLNQVRRGIYSKLRQAVEQAAPEVAPLNEAYGNALEAQTAAARRAVAGERNNSLSLSDLLGGMAGSIASAARGSGLLDDVIAGAALGGLNKLNRSTLGATGKIAALKASGTGLPRGAKNLFLATQGGNRLLDDAGSGQ